MAPDLSLRPNQVWLGKMDFCDMVSQALHLDSAMVENEAALSTIGLLKITEERNCISGELDLKDIVASKQKPKAFRIGLGT